MKIYDYFMMNSHSQAINLAIKGVFVAKIDEGKTFKQLYSLSEFFVELEQDKSTKKLVGRAIFQSGSQLEKYLPYLPLSI